MPAQLFAAEGFLPGHSDKRCDTAADALVEAALRLEPLARCRVVVAQHGGSAFVGGRIVGLAQGRLDPEAVVRPVLGDVSVICDLQWAEMPEDGRQARGMADRQAVVV